MGRLTDDPQICYMRLITAKWQIVLCDQFEERHAFDDPRNRVHVRNPVCECLIAMGAIFRSQRARWQDGVPERVIAQRFQPGFHIFECLKNYHGTSLPKHGLNAQI